MTPHRFTTLIAAAALSVLPLAACSSSGGGSGSVSTSQLESKLKSEPQLKQVTSQGGLTGAVADKIIDCIAQALQKDADPSALKDYVSGKKSIDSVNDKGATKSTSALENDSKTCIQQVAKNVSTAPAGG